MAHLQTSHRQLASQGCRWMLSINCTLPELACIFLWRRTHPTTLWSPPLVICRHHPNRRGLTPHRCFYIRVVTAERTHGCGMSKRSLPLCTQSAARIMPMRSSKRYLRSVVFLSVFLCSIILAISPRSFMRYKWLSRGRENIGNTSICQLFYPAHNIFPFRVVSDLALTVLCTSVKR